MKKRTFALFACLSAASALSGAPSAAVQSSFARPPTAALKALKASVGKPFSSGWVFIDGRYVPPPYKVERWGNAIRINGIQATSEIVPWEEFVKTQEGVVVSRTETAPPPPSAEPVAEEPEEDDSFDDLDATLDDLFDDDPAPKKKSAPKGGKKKKAVRSAPPKPVVTVTYSFDGEFAHNEKTKAYLERINAERTRIDRQLRAGGYFFFGSRYSAVSGDAGAAEHLFEKLAGIMKRSANRGAFVSAMFSAGLNYLPQPLLDDLFQNRVGYVQLEARVNGDAERRKWFKGGY